MKRFWKQVVRQILIAEVIGILLVGVIYLLLPASEIGHATGWIREVRGWLRGR
jgi:hypothetical protein